MLKVRQALRAITTATLATGQRATGNTNRQQNRATGNGHKVDRWWGRCYLLLLLLQAFCRQVVCGVDVAGSRSPGVQYEPQLRHLIEHLLTRLGMLTYYWPCSQMLQLPLLLPSPLLAVAACCRRCQLPVDRSLSGYGSSCIGVGIGCVCVGVRSL